MPRKTSTNTNETTEHSNNNINIIEEIQEEETINLNKEREIDSNIYPQEIKARDMNTGELSERVVIKSSNDTRLVNNDEDNRKYCLVEENENKTENEFVFSENVNIDNLSYNEPIIESFKKQHNEAEENK